jgi:hypothetical protein
MAHLSSLLVCSVVAATLVTSALGQTQTASEQTEQPGSTVGTVVSVSRQTMTLRTGDNQFQLFVFNNNMVRPKGLSPGSRIRVESSATDEMGVRMATRVTVLEAAATTASGPAQDMAPPPKEVRDVEREIERQARRWQLGARIGAGLDPELFMLGVHAGIGPIFSRDFYFRPNAEFAFGELTDMVALNLEGAYRLPISFRHGRWSAYVGAGPGLNFVHQGIGRRDVDFGNFDYDTSLNVFSGLRFRRGTFVEVKTSLWAPAVPTLRLIFGYTF